MWYGSTGGSSRVRWPRTFSAEYSMTGHSGFFLRSSTVRTNARLDSANMACAMVTPCSLHAARMRLVSARGYETVGTSVRRGPSRARGKAWPPCRRHKILISWSSPKMDEEPTHHQLRLLAGELDLGGGPAHLAPRGRHDELALHRRCEGLRRFACGIASRFGAGRCRLVAPCRQHRLDVLAQQRFVAGPTREQREELVRRGVQRHAIADEVRAEEEQVVLLLALGVDCEVRLGGREGRLGRRDDEVGEVGVGEQTSAVEVLGADRCRLASVSSATTSSVEADALCGSCPVTSSSSDAALARVSAELSGTSYLRGSEDKRPLGELHKYSKTRRKRMSW